MNVLLPLCNLELLVHSQSGGIYQQPVKSHMMLLMKHGVSGVVPQFKVEMQGCGRREFHVIKPWRMPAKKATELRSLAVDPRMTFMHGSFTGKAGRLDLVERMKKRFGAVPA